MSVSLFLFPLSSPSTKAVPRISRYKPARQVQRQFTISSFKVRGFNGNSETSDSVATAKRGWEDWLAGSASLYPVYVTVGGLIAFVKPSTYSWFVSLAPTSYSWTLSFIMLAMGITVEFKELINLFRQRPLSILFGCLSQYTIMPALGTIVSKLLGLSPSLSVGLILLSCCPGGTASNVVTLIAQGDVPLSIVMTVCTTLGAVILTPLLSNILAGAYVPINVVELSVSTLQVVVAPVLLGSYLQSKFRPLVKRLTPFAPIVAVLSSSLLASSVFSQNVYRLKSTSSLSSNASSSSMLHIQQLLSSEMCSVVASVLLLHLSGFFVGYACAAMAGLKERQRRAISIEVGMQNSSLGVVLATCHFTSPMVAVPAAISAVIMNVAGSTLGLVWKHIDPCED